MNKKIIITKKYIADLISNNGKRKMVYNVKANVRREERIEFVIFKDGTNLDDGKGPSAKDLTNNIDFGSRSL